MPVKVCTCSGVGALGYIAVSMPEHGKDEKGLYFELKVCQVTPFTVSISFQVDLKYYYRRTLNG